MYYRVYYEEPKFKSIIYDEFGCLSDKSIKELTEFYKNKFKYVRIDKIIKETIFEYGEQSE